MIERWLMQSLRSPGNWAPLANPAARFLSALALVILTTVAGYLIQHSLVNWFPLILFGPALIIAAFLGGFWPGVFATMVALLLSNIYLMPPRFQLMYYSGAIVPSAVFVIFGVMISALAGGFHRLRDRLRRELLEEQRHFSLLQAITSGTTDVVYAKDREGRYLFVNRGLTQAVSKSSEELMGKTDFDLFPYEDAQRMRERDLQVMRTMQFTTFDEVVTVGEQMMTLLTTKGPFFAANGQVAGTIGICRDITQRKQAEDRLRESEAQLRLATEVARVGTWSWDLNTDEVQRPPETAKLLGWPSGEVAKLGDEYLQLIHPEDRPRVLAAVRKAIEQNTFYQAEYRIIWPDQSEHWVMDRAEAFYDEEGRPQRMVGALMDIDERKRVEEERARWLQSEQAARRDAEAASRAKDEFLATLSHELRTPLTAILGWARILRSAGTDEQTREEGVDVIERNAQSQAQLIDDLLDISRIITGRLRLNLQHVDLVPVIHAALDTVRPAIDCKRIELKVQLDHALGPVSGDPARLQQVVWNLLSNAAKFTPEQGRIDVQLLRRNSTACIVVRDTGIGIRPDFLPHVFERFRQADASTMRQYGGMGLGLAIARHVVELHGGKIRVESAGENQGSTFTVDLPTVRVATRPRPSQPAVSSDQTEAERLGGLNVLVVDDEPDARRLLEMVLGRCGARVDQAASAEQAMAALRNGSRHMPDILVCDVAMPGEDGYSLMRRIRAMEGHPAQRLPAIALTAYARDIDRQAAMEAGFNAYMSKPADPQELCANIQRLTRSGA